MKERKGQIWIETVLYTLIGLAIIGLVLSFAYPKITAARERILVEQSIESLQALNSVINLVVERGPENAKSYEFTLRRGEIIINATGNSVVFIIPDLGSEYSEPNIALRDGDVSIVTVPGKKGNSVLLRSEYAVNIKYEGSDTPHQFTPAPVPYRLLVRNVGNSNGNVVVNIEEIS